MMNLRYLYIIMCIFSLLALPGCRDEEAVQTSEGTRTVTVNLGIAMSRVTEGSSIGDGSTPKDMKVWIFNQDDTKLIDYYEVQSPQFLGSDILGELVNTDEHVFELDNTITDLHFYAVLNSESGTGLDLSKASTPTQIESATFTALNEVAGDNQVPVYGKATLDVSDHKNSYPVTIETKRAVSKLELFFTKESESSSLAINKITLTNIPDKGFLAKEITATDIANYNRSEVLFNQSLTIDKTLAESEAQVGDFSNHPANFTSVTLSQPYLLENPNNEAWDDNKQTDYEYPDIEPSNENAYILQVDYTLDGTQKTQAICLPEIKRNVWNKIYARVTSSGYELLLSVNPWDMEDITVDYEDNLSFASQGWNGLEGADPIIELIENGKTVHFLHPEETVTLRFVVNSPIGAEWAADLSGDVTAFDFVGEHSGIVSKDESQTIAIRCTDPESTETHRATLHVYVRIGNKSYELDLTDPSVIGPIDDPNCFTLLQQQG